MARPPSRSWRTPDRRTDWPVSPAYGHPADHQCDGSQRQRHREYRYAGQVGQQRNQRAEGERQQRCGTRQERRWQLVGVHAEFLAGMDTQRGTRVAGHGHGHPGGGVRIGAILAEIPGQLLLLSGGKPGQHLPLE